MGLSVTALAALSVPYQNWSNFGPQAKQWTLPGTIVRPNPECLDTYNNTHSFLQHRDPDGICWTENFGGEAGQPFCSRTRQHKAQPICFIKAVNLTHGISHDGTQAGIQGIRFGGCDKSGIMTGMYGTPDGDHGGLGIHWFNTTISDPFVHVAGRTADGVVHALKFTTKSGRSKEYGFITGPKVKKGNVFDLDLGKGLVGASGTAGVQLSRIRFKYLCDPPSPPPPVPVGEVAFKATLGVCGRTDAYQSWHLGEHLGGLAHEIKLHTSKTVEQSMCLADTSVRPPTKSATWNEHKKTHCYGDGHGGVPIGDVRPIKDAAMCRGACDADPDCIAVTHSPDGKDGKPHCLLLSFMNEANCDIGTEKFTTYASPWTQHTGFNCRDGKGGVGMTLSDTPLPNMTPGRCADACAATPGCRAFTIERGEHAGKPADCWLRAAIDLGECLDGDGKGTKYDTYESWLERVNTDCYDEHGGGLMNPMDTPKELGPKKCMTACANEKVHGKLTEGRAGIGCVGFVHHKLHDGSSRCFLRQTIDLAQCNRTAVPSAPTKNDGYTTYQQGATPGVSVMPCDRSDSRQHWHVEEHVGGKRVRNHDKSQCLHLPSTEEDTPAYLGPCDDWRAHTNRNCAPGHGGTPVDPADVPLTGQTAASCSAACAATKGCAAFVLGTGNKDSGDCYLRSSVNLDSCKKTGDKGVPAYDTYEPATTWFHDLIAHPSGLLRTQVQDEDAGERKCLGAVYAPGLPGPPPDEAANMCQAVTELLPMVHVKLPVVKVPGIIQIHFHDGLTVQLGYNSAYRRCGIFDPYVPLTLKSGTLGIALTLAAVPWALPWIHFDAIFGVSGTMSTEGSNYVKILIGVDYNLTAIGHNDSKAIDCHNFHYTMPETHMAMELFGGGHLGGGIADNIKGMIKKGVTEGVDKAVNGKIMSKYCPIGGFEKERVKSCAEEAAEGGPAALLRCAWLGPNFDLDANMEAPVATPPAEAMSIDEWPAGFWDNYTNPQDWNTTAVVQVA